jgi:hypothetical protein
MEVDEVLEARIALAFKCGHSFLKRLHLILSSSLTVSIIGSQLFIC